MLASQNEFSSCKELVRDARMDDEEELREIARIYENVPLSWDSAYRIPDGGVDRTYRWLSEKRATLKCLVVEKGGKIAGVHVLGLQENRREVCLIKTLWVAPELRGRGIASSLKSSGESWARSRGATTIVTHVMLKNPKMIEINQHRGFVPMKLEMEKPLL